MKPVSLQAVVEEMNVFGDEMAAYINNKTGELFTLSDEMAGLVEAGAEDDDFDHDWQKENLSKTREVLESGDFISLPDKFEIHEYAIMERFCLSVSDDQIREQLLNAIRGQGAFRRFRDTIHRRQIQDDWYKYRNDALNEIAADFLEAEGIAFVD